MLLARRVAVVLLAFTTCTCSQPAGKLVASDKKVVLRSMKYTSRSQDKAIAWQKDLRSRFAVLLRMDDQVSSKTRPALNPKTISSEKVGKYVLHEMEINSTATRRIKIILTLPAGLKGPFPAVVAIGGHGTTRHSCHKSPDGPAGFGHVLAETGYVTISTRVSQHRPHVKKRTLMGERLWDLMRCVDLLESLEQVDAKRIGCGGLSLGGEMSMWLGAMDERMVATVSSGFLTKMDQLERGHCRCWKFRGLRELVDFADIYSMTAPRALLCQNGLKERPTWFTVPLAREALEEIKVIYADFKRPENVSLVAHEGGHVTHVPSLVAFFAKHLGRPKQ